MDIFQLDGIPMFNEDDEKPPPSSVLELKKRIRRADAVLIVTPEYNYSIPGILCIGEGQGSMARAHHARGYL